MDVAGLRYHTGKVRKGFLSRVSIQLLGLF